MDSPNFLLFITDQHRVDHLGVYGNQVVRTPNLDELAARSWIADQCFVASPVCMPNRASLMTGRMPCAHGVRSNGIPLSRRATTFVEMLREGGYRTGLVGKAHLQNMTGKPPIWPPSGERLSHDAWTAEPGELDVEWGPRWVSDLHADVTVPFYGFEHVDLVIGHGDTAGGHYRQWLEREHPTVAALTGKEHALPSDYALFNCGQAWRSQVPEEFSITRWIANRTRELIRQWASDRRPFFVQCSFPDPHHPFNAPAPYWEMYRPEQMELSPSFYFDGPKPPHLSWLHNQRDEGRAVKHTPAPFACTEREAKEAIALNYGSITHIDAAIGSVLKELRNLGLENNTIIVFISDHGDYVGDHQLLLKGPLHYSSIVRVPLIWCDPVIARGTRSDALCSTIDLAPTFLERAGIERFHGMQGRSLLPAMEPRRDQNWSYDAVLIEEEAQRLMFDFPGLVRARTVRTTEWRLSLYDGVEWGELYDLANDPLECTNLWDVASYAQRRAQLVELLARKLLMYADTSPYPSAAA